MLGQRTTEGWSAAEAAAYQREYGRDVAGRAPRRARRYAWRLLARRLRAAYRAFVEVPRGSD